MYLERVLEDDQAVRDSEESARITMQYGRNSKENRDYVEKQWRMDELNLFKIESYISIFGYPSKAELGEIAALAPWIVIHHSTEMDVRNRNFKHLYKAYLDGNTDDNALVMYLNRSYRMTFREDFYIESPFKAEDEINGLINALDFNQVKEEVLKKSNS